MAKISLQNIRKVYPGGVEVVPKLNLEIADKEFVVLVGPSGCGKTTVTRLINGLIPHFYEGELTGSVRVCGMNVPEEEIATFAGKVKTVVGIHTEDEKED